MAKKISGTLSKNPPVKEPVWETVTFTLTVSGEIFDRISKYKEEKGLLKEQEVCRMALGYFLKAQGF